MGLFLKLHSGDGLEGDRSIASSEVGSGGGVSHYIALTDVMWATHLLHCASVIVKDTAVAS